jgi:hypothetical protein
MSGGVCALAVKTKSAPTESKRAANFIMTRPPFSGKPPGWEQQIDTLLIDLSVHEANQR